MNSLSSCKCDLSFSKFYLSLVSCRMTYWLNYLSFSKLSLSLVSCRMTYWLNYLSWCKCALSFSKLSLALIKLSLSLVSCRITYWEEADEGSIFFLWVKISKDKSQKIVHSCLILAIKAADGFIIFIWSDIFIWSESNDSPWIVLLM